MFELPSVPSRGALHSAISRFANALLLVAPLLVLAGLLMTRRRQGTLAWVFLLCYAGASILRLNAAHTGGVLVRTLGGHTELG